MKSVIIERKSTSVELKNQKIITASKMIPLRLVDFLILTQEVAVSPKTLLRLSEKNIAVMFISKDSKHFALTLPQKSKNSELKMMQYKALNQNLHIAKNILFEKIKTHKESLEKLGIEIAITDEAAKIALADSIDSLLGIEGAFARKYFDHYFSLFEKRLTKGYRSKNPPQDPVNAMLSFIYTIFYNQLTAKLYMRGFDPSISYLHVPFRSHYALSSDILETLRSDINLFVFSLFNEKYLSCEDFSSKGGIYLKYDSRRELWTHLKPFMDKMNKKANISITSLKKMVMEKAA